MPRFTALEPIEHDGKRVEPGSTLDLTAEQAEPLLALKHVKAGGRAKAGESSGEAQPPIGAGEGAGAGAAAAGAEGGVAQA